MLQAEGEPRLISLDQICARGKILPRPVRWQWFANNTNSAYNTILTTITTSGTIKARNNLVKTAWILQLILHGRLNENSVHFWKDNRDMNSTCSAGHIEINSNWPSCPVNRPFRCIYCNLFLSSAWFLRGQDCFLIYRNWPLRAIDVTE